MALLRDYLITLASRVAGAVASLLSLPLMLEHLSSSEYSLIAFASLVNGYANILDAGLSPELASNVSKNSEHRNHTLQIIKASTRSFVVKLSKYGLLLLLPLLATAYVTFPNLSLERLIIFCAILLLDAFVSAIFRLQYSALQGLGDHAIANSLHALNISIRTALAVGLVILGHRVEFIFIVQPLITCAFILASFNYYSKRRFSSCESSWIFIQATKGSISNDLTLIAIFLAIINSIPLIVLGRLGGSDELNHFFLATSLGGIVATLQGSLISVMIPSLSRELVKSTLNSQPRDFRVLSRNVVCISFAVSGFAFCLAEPIVSMWIRKTGANLILLTALFQFQLIAAAFVSLTIVPYVLSIPLHQTRIQFIGVGIYLIACCIILPLARMFGTIELFGFMSMLAGIFFSIGYFLASSNIIKNDSRPIHILAFIFGPALFIVIALIVAHMTGEMLSSNIGAPAWLISSSIYVFFIFCSFLFARKLSLPKL